MGHQYLRFVTCLKDAETSKDLGVFRAFGKLEETDKLETWAQDRGTTICMWFDLNLKAPELKASHWRAVFWFQAVQQDMVRMLWELVAILEEHAIIVEFTSTDNPGHVVYRDSYQVAAIPHRRKARNRK